MSEFITWYSLKLFSNIDPVFEGITSIMMCHGKSHGYFLDVVDNTELVARVRGFLNEPNTWPYYDSATT